MQYKKYEPFAVFVFFTNGGERGIRVIAKRASLLAQNLNAVFFQSVFVNCRFILVTRKTV